jgi:hypothetical protein
MRLMPISDDRDMSQDRDVGCRRIETDKCSAARRYFSETELRKQHRITHSGTRGEVIHRRLSVEIIRLTNFRNAKFEPGANDAACLHIADRAILVGLQ